MRRINKSENAKVKSFVIPVCVAIPESKKNKGDGMNNKEKMMQKYEVIYKLIEPYIKKYASWTEYRNIISLMSNFENDITDTDLISKNELIQHFKDVYEKHPNLISMKKSMLVTVINDIEKFGTE